MAHRQRNLQWKSESFASLWCCHQSFPSSDAVLKLSAGLHSHWNTQRWRECTRSSSAQIRNADISVLGAIVLDLINTNSIHYRQQICASYNLSHSKISHQSPTAMEGDAMRRLLEIQMSYSSAWKAHQPILASYHFFLCPFYNTSTSCSVEITQVTTDTTSS